MNIMNKNNPVNPENLVNPVQKRRSGVLLHPTSLPGPYGIGDLGLEAYKFADFLVTAGQSLWQVLPLGPTGYGDSPYACYSAFAGNTLLVSRDQLIKEGLLDAAPQSTGSPNKIDFGEAHNLKDQILRRAYERYTKTTDTALRSAFETFAQQHAHWLEDYALFRALKDAHGGVAWNDWEPALTRRTPSALERARECGERCDVGIAAPRRRRRESSSRIRGRPFPWPLRLPSLPASCSAVPASY